MPDFFRDFEVSAQRLSSTAAGPHALTASRPLHELTELAPALPVEHNDWISFPFANDECTAPYFKQLQARVETPGYQAAANRVALVVGESALAANLQYIPEETIIILDFSVSMLNFMKRYIAGLRTAQTPEEWVDFIGTVPTSEPRRSTLRSHIRSASADQAEIGSQSGYATPLTDQEAFDTASQIAQQKAIIPWYANIKNEGDMAELGDVLASQDATVTMMNLTNVLSSRHTLTTAKAGAEILAYLPVSPEAPILTTTTLERPRVSEDNNILPLLEVTGPFFGLKNLAIVGGNITQPPYGALVQRQFAELAPSEEAAFV